MTAQDHDVTALPGFYGFREVSGLRTVDGLRVRRGLLYRSGTPQFLAADDARRLHRATGLRTAIDLRLVHEVAQEGRGPLEQVVPRYLSVPIQARYLVDQNSAVAPMPGADPLVEAYLGYLRAGPEPFASLVRALAEPDALPALVHCTVGKDRTGAAIAVVLDALHVVREDIATDYAAQPEDVTRGMERLRQMPSYGDAVDVYPPEAYQAPADVIHRFLARVDTEFGGSRTLLAEHGVDDATFNELRSRLMTPADQFS